MMFPIFIVDLSVRRSFALLGLPAKWNQGLHCRLFDYALRLRAYNSIQKATLGVVLGAPTHLCAGVHRYKPSLFESASRFAPLPAINAKFLTRCETMRHDCRDRRKLQNPLRIAQKKKNKDRDKAKCGETKAAAFPWSHPPRSP